MKINIVTGPGVLSIVGESEGVTSVISVPAEKAPDLAGGLLVKAGEAMKKLEEKEEDDDAKPTKKKAARKRRSATAK